ncbi:uncharacterized protein LOC130448791 isoform X2 [Diorhabda sublineata]|uniref:uncharacterized protein LOC130448791 isoform X2 n=1 Tax=Diorhabda sublineata TaxID=1163346 RepID=UPI0024E06449|nr:uncharacterized protein LOC130448791 isoform X2 [Diorhabda sublineata]
MRCLKRKRPRCISHLLVAIVCALALTTVACLVAETSPREITNFVSTNVLTDGEVETRIYYKGLSAKETRVASGSNYGLTFRQLTRNSHFIQMIYDEDHQLIDCEFGHDQNQTKTFLSSFKRDLSNLITTSNITMESLDGKQLPQEFHWMNYTHLREDCRKRHKEIRASMKKEKEFLDSQRFGNKSKRSILLMPGTNWCGDRNRARTYTDIGNFVKTDRCCRRHDFCKIDIPGLTTKYDYFNFRLFTLSHCRCDARSKRNVDDIFRVPGTKWCGKGYSADKYTRLGGFSRTDRCCRKHDLRCPFWINGFETKYGLFNWRINTLMHCNCDERFRACLKRVGSSDANLVGKLFFNIVQTKCFVLKPKKNCVKYSWWGKCEKFKMVKQAILRDNLPY